MKKSFRRAKKAVKSLLFSFAKRNERFRKLLRHAIFKKRLRCYKKRAVGETIDDKSIVFSSFAGREYNDSPKALYEYMLSEEKYKDYKFVWAFKKPEDFSFLLKNPNTSIVKANSKEYERSLITSKFWLMNYRVGDHIYPTGEQVYVQLWHGTPLKKLGYDIQISDNAMNSKTEICEKYRIDAEKFKYILAPSEFAKEKFISAWNLKAVGKVNSVLLDGYPRNDFLVNFTGDDASKIKRKLGISDKAKKIILYAPTWRDNQHTSGIGYTYNLEIDFDFLKEKLGDDYVILFRAHYLVANGFDFEKYSDFVYNVSDYGDVNELYIVSDILITDYSSVFFDFAILKRPIIFYMYDLKRYGEEIRGFYLDLTQLPGSIAENENELINLIEKTKDFVADEKYLSFNNKFNSLDDGNASKRVTKYIIDDN